MKLDLKALEAVFTEVNEFDDEQGKAIAVGLIETYLKKLGATNHQTAVINLTDARAGLQAIMQTCAKADSVIRTIRRPDNQELADAFIGYIQIIYQQANAHYSGHLN